MRRLPFVLLLAATACGDDGGNNTRADAAVGDDANDIDAAPTGMVTLTVKLNGAAVAGVRVHFQNPDSSLIASVDTNASGVATAMMPTGGWVTAINPFGPAPGVAEQVLWTYANVQPGDELKLEETDSPSFVRSQTITAATDGDATVDSYRITSPCDDNSNTSPTVTLNVNTNCDPMTDLLVQSLDDDLGEIVHFVHASNVSTSGALNISNMALAGAPTDKTYTFNNYLGLGAADATVELWTPRGRLYSVSDGGDALATVSSTYKVPGFTGAVEYVYAEDESAYSFHYFGDWATFAAADFTSDLNPRRLRNATDGATYDPVNKVLTWTEETTGVVADFAHADMQYYRDNVGYFRWNVVATNVPGEVQFPTLPVETTDYNVNDATDVTDPFVTVGKVPDWNAVRESFFALPGREALALLSTSGSSAFQEIPAGTGLLRRLRLPLMPERKGAGLTRKRR